jgi:flavin reductase (DIM6/NTAB) family NADH-FMN oxidoreductase RutF
MIENRRSSPETHGGTTPGVDPADFKRALARLAGGITVITSVDGEGSPVGLTATSVCSVSLDPPLVLVCIGTGSRTHAAIAESGRYAINVLGAGHRSLSERFAGSGEGKFEGLSWEVGRFGLPLLPGAISICECEVDRRVPAGDHTIFIARVVASAAIDDAEAMPLLWYLGAHRGLGNGNPE